MASASRVSVEMTCRVLMPVRVEIHSSLVSKKVDKSSFEIVMAGCMLPVPKIFKMFTPCFVCWQTLINFQWYAE